VRILVLDDAAMTRYVVKSALEKAGYEVSEATNGTDALRILDDEIIDLVVTDLNMPGMDGFTFFEQAFCKKRIAAIALTACSDETTISKAASFGFKDVIMKPLKVDRFLELVQKYSTKDPEKQVVKVRVAVQGCVLAKVQPLARAANLSVEDYLGKFLNSVSSLELPESAAENAAESAPEAKAS
jgi:two-component system, chemotaxis family, chemotaxis protein CheY